MCTRPRRVRFALLAAVLSLASACGDDPKGGAGGGSGGSGGGAPSASGIPWRDGPSPDLREGLEHVPDLPGGVAEIVDLAVVRRSPKGLRVRSEYGAAQVRRFFVHTMGVPEDALGFAVHVSRKEEGTSWTSFDAMKVPLDVVRRGAAEKGFEEYVEPTSKLTAWRYPDAQEPIALASEGWVFSAPRIGGDGGRDRGTIDVSLFSPERSVVRTRPGLLGAAGAIPADALSRGSVEVTWGAGVSKGQFGPGVVPAAHVQWKDLSPPGAGIVLHFERETSRGYARKEIERLYEEGRKAGKPFGRITFEERGPYLRLHSFPGENADQALSEAVGSDLRALAQALRDYREREGRWPTTEEGLAVLAAPPGLLDDFVGLVPRDAWDRAYHYRAPATADAAPDLRSAGPDGAVDTADDVTPGE